MTEIERINNWKNESLNKLDVDHQSRMTKLDALDARLENASRDETISLLKEALAVCNISGGAEKMTFNL